MKWTAIQAMLAQEEKDKNSRVIAIQPKDSSDKPIFRLVFRKAVQYYLNDTVKVMLKNDKPLIDYVHADDKEQANLFGFDMCGVIDYVFCYDETEEIQVKDIVH